MIDLRSDTVTRPSPAMRDAMASAEVGDDVFGDDPTLNALQEEVAALVGKEAALWVPSGTMANQLALRAQTQPGDEIILHARAHIRDWESGGPAALSGVTCRAVESADGSLPMEEVAAQIRDASDAHRAPTAMICVENTHNACGGRVVAQEGIEALGELARGRGLRMHLDGARLWNAAVASGRSLAELTAPFDSVSLCFSKGLGAPMGSVLVADAATIRRAHRFRKMFGGGVRQGGVVAAAARFALEHHLARLAEDHANARRFAEALADIAGVRVEPGSVQTNLVYFELQEGHRLRSAPGGAVAAMAAAGVAITGGGSRYRAVFHLDVDAAATDAAIEAARTQLAG